MGRRLGRPVALARVEFFLSMEPFSPRYLAAMTFRDGDGVLIESSLAGKGLPLSLFRLRTRVELLDVACAFGAGEGRDSPKRFDDGHRSGNM